MRLHPGDHFPVVLKFCTAVFSTWVGVGKVGNGFCFEFGYKFCFKPPFSCSEDLVSREVEPVQAPNNTAKIYMMRIDMLFIVSL